MKFKINQADNKIHFSISPLKNHYVSKNTLHINFHFTNKPTNAI